MNDRFRLKGHNGKDNLRRPLTKHLTLDADELEYLEHKAESLDMAAVRFIRSKVFQKGWREELQMFRAGAA